MKAFTIACGLLCTSAAAEESLTISPISYTYHGDIKGAHNDPVQIKARTHATGDGINTVHPGLSLIYKRDGKMYSAFAFRDSYGNPAGGLLYGHHWTFFKYFEVGIASGPYIRPRPSKTKRFDPDSDPEIRSRHRRAQYVYPLDFPISIKLKDIEIAPLTGVTAAVTVPVSKGHGISVNCLINVLINNCQFGWKISF